MSRVMRSMKCAMVMLGAPAPPIMTAQASERMSFFVRGRLLLVCALTKRFRISGLSELTCVRRSSSACCPSFDTPDFAFNPSYQKESKMRYFINGLAQFGTEPKAFMTSPPLSNKAIKLVISFPLFMKPKGLPKAKLAAIISLYFVILGLWCLRYLQITSKEKYFANKISIADSSQVVRLTPLIPVQSRRPRRRFVEEDLLQRQNTLYQSPFIIVQRSRLKHRVQVLPLTIWKWESLADMMVGLSW
jgi:hypothetical protein